MQYLLSIVCSTDNYMKLLGIGGRTATWLAFYTMDMPEDDAEDFSKSLVQVKENLYSCPICGNITESDPCEVYRDTDRNRSTAIVVGQPKSVMAFGEIGECNGLYHILHDILSLMDGVSPEEVNIKSLITRLRKQDEAKEVILALDSSPESEATAIYLTKLIKPAGLKVTRLVARLAIGNDIEYAGPITLEHTVQGRTDL